jgi:hypothetical protein
MNLALFIGTLLVACDATPVDDMLAKINHKFARLEAENAEMKAQIAELKAQVNSTIAGELKMFIDGRTECPSGYIEADISGRVVVARPKGGETGAVYNRPLDAGEIGRTPAHLHTATVNDPG